MPPASRCAGCDVGGGPFPKPYPGGLPPRTTRCAGCHQHRAVWRECELPGCAFAQKATRCTELERAGGSVWACVDCAFAEAAMRPSARRRLPARAPYERAANPRSSLAVAHRRLADSGLRPDVWIDPTGSRCGLHVARTALRRRFGLVALLANPTTTGWPPPGDAPIVSTRRGTAAPGGRVHYLGQTLSRIGKRQEGLEWQRFLKDPGHGDWAAVPVIQACAAVARIAKDDDRPHPQPERPTAQSDREKQFRQSLHLSTAAAYQA